MRRWKQPQRLGSWVAMAMLVGGCSSQSAAPSSPDSVVVDVPDERGTAAADSTTGSPRPSSGDAASAADRAASSQEQARSKSQEIARQLAEIEVEMLGALQDGGNVVDLLGGGAPTGLLDDAAASAAGVQGSGHGAGRVTAGTGVAGGGSAGGLAALRGGPGAETAPPTASEPQSRATVGAARVSGGTIAHASAVVARHRGRMRRCHQAALAADPTERGTASLAVDVGEHGDVTAVRVEHASGLAQRTVGCLRAVVGSVQFAPPDTGQATVSFDVRFDVDP